MNRLTRAYHATALIGLNTLLVFVVVNVLLGLGIAGRTALAALRASPTPSGLFTPDGAPVDTGRRSAYQLRDFDASAYPDLEPAGIAEVLDDFYDLAQRGFIYQPWVQFAEPTFAGRRVTVVADELGVPMRTTTNPSLGGPAVRIYVFGGSTTFGYNVADEHTWPSYLSRILNQHAPVEVRNYGRGFYYPSQEVALLVDLLRSGHRPSLAIFMDGVNVGFGQDVPHFSARVGKAMHDRQHTRGDWAAVRSLELSWLPAWRVARWALRPSPEPQAEAVVETDVRAFADMLARRFDENRRLAEAIGDLYDVPVLRVIQPNPLVNYPVKLYRTPRTERYMRARQLATALYDRLRAQDGNVFLGDLLDEWGHRKAVVDDAHYNPAFSEFLARRLREHIPSRLAVSATALDQSAVTGEVRKGRPRSPLL